MSEPTGKLKFAYRTIVDLEQQLKERDALLRACEIVFGLIERNIEIHGVNPRKVVAPMTEPIPSTVEEILTKLRKNRNKP